LLFAKEGAAVAIADISEKAGKEALDKALQYTTQAIFVKTDVSKENEVKALIEAGEKAFGKVNVVFNNAGIMDPRDDNAETTPEDVWDKSTNIYFKCM
jgi:NAD(P)-dependent dehydrogenase (short-subunit alcohol dehydrogenase family)